MKLSSNTTTFYGLFNSCFSLIIWSLFDVFRLTFHFCDPFACFYWWQSENDLHPKCNKHLTLLLPIQLSNEWVYRIVSILLNGNPFGFFLFHVLLHLFFFSLFSFKDVGKLLTDEQNGKRGKEFAFIRVQKYAVEFACKNCYVSGYIVCHISEQW